MSYEVQIKVNSLAGYDSNAFPENFEENLIKTITETKESEGWSEYLKSINSDWMPGRRYEDNERVAHVIMGAMYNAVINSLKIDRFDKSNQPLIEMRCLAYTTNIDNETLNEWIYKALDYSGGCDHWYTYEKDWS